MAYSGARGTLIYEKPEVENLVSAYSGARGTLIYEKP